MSSGMLAISFNIVQGSVHIKRLQDTKIEKKHMPNEVDRVSREEKVQPK